MDTSPIVIDIETAPLPNARDYCDPPDLSDVTAPSNYKDAEKIAAFIAQAKIDKVVAFERDLAEKAALDWHVGCIVGIGWWTQEGGLHSRMCYTEDHERDALEEVWRTCQHRTIVGFNIKMFDVKFMSMRSRYLGVPYPVLDLGKFARQGITDLYLELTFGDGKFDQGVMRRTLQSFCRRFGIPVADPISGADVPRLIAAGEWAAVRAHMESDVWLEVQLAQKMGIISAVGTR